MHQSARIFSGNASAPPKSASEKAVPRGSAKRCAALPARIRALEPWQQDIVAIVREEALYFAPQRQTKILNEGWASFWHSTIMTRHVLSPDELIDYADHHSGTLATSPGRLNPYKLGIELLRDIEDRWNRGAFGPEYEACTSQAERANWDRQLGLGREKIFEVRRIYNDIGFIDEFLTRDLPKRSSFSATATTDAPVAMKWKAATSTTSSANCSPR
ncbi:MAG: SpoVR family protein [Caldilineaceae bacterium]